MAKQTRTCKLLDDWGAWVRTGLNDIGWHRADVISRLMRYGGIVSGGRVGNPVPMHVERLKYETCRLIRIDNAIRGLSRRQREPLVRYYVLKQDQTEIAQKIGIVRSSVSRRLERARQHIDEQISTRPSEPETRFTDAVWVNALRRTLADVGELTNAHNCA